MVTREVRRGMKASTVVVGPGNWLISALGATLEESRPIPGKVHIVVSVSNRSLHRSARVFVIYSCDYNHLRYKALTKRKTLKKTIITGVIARATDREDANAAGALFAFAFKYIRFGWLPPPTRRLWKCSGAFVLR